MRIGMTSPSFDVVAKVPIGTPTSSMVEFDLIEAISSVYYPCCKRWLKRRTP
jgi:hypothetical protein